MVLTRTTSRMRETMPNSNLSNTPSKSPQKNDTTYIGKVSDISQYSDINITNENTTKTNHVIEVEVNVQLFRVLMIDDSTEHITVDLGLSFQWIDEDVVQECREYHFATHPAITRRVCNSKKVKAWPDNFLPGVGAFDPAWKIENSETSIIKSITQVRDPFIGLVHNYTHLIAKVHYPMKMENFPFDCQLFSFKIRSEYETKIMKFIRFKDSRSAQVFEEETTEWYISRELSLCFNVVDNKKAASGINKY